jgi:ATP-dependent DNA ligase
MMPATKEDMVKLRDGVPFDSYGEKVIPEQVHEILTRLESDNSRLFKETVLTINENHEQLKRVLKAALDPYTQYYQRKIPEFERSCEATTKTLDWALDQLVPLTKREYTGNAAIEHLQKILVSLTDENAEVIKRVITKDLKCGVSIKTVNKVFGKDFIETYPCMLASAFNQKSFEAIKYPALLQTKMDGMRANIIIDKEGNVDVRSRNGKQISLEGHFDEFVLQVFYKSATLNNLDNFFGAVLDGELLVLDEKEEKVLDRKTGNGILNKAVKGTITPEETRRVRLMCWDMIPLDHFKKGFSAIPYFDRLDVLQERMDAVYNVQEKQLIMVLKTAMVASYEDAESIFNEALADGEEGVIVKNGDSPWENKRSKYQVKMKAELEADLLVEAVNYGTGKYEHLVGSLSCVSKDGSLTVNVGSGLTDEDRKKPFKDYVGKIVSVKYNEKIKDKNSDNWSLFLPIFQELRLDKSEADNI